MIKEWLRFMGEILIFNMVILVVAVIATIIINYLLGNVGVC